MIIATVKYIMRPVTSTKVATNGAEALAGSSRHIVRMKGNIEPAIEPNSTTPTRLAKIVKATRM
jgi:hypothetical protein